MMHSLLLRRSPLAGAVRGTICLGVPLAIVAFLGPSILSGAQERTAISFFISLIAVVGLGIYAGNSGIVSFGHVAFMAIGAYVSGLLTITPQLKGATLPALPDWLVSLHLELLPAAAVAIAVVAVVALLVGIPIARLSGASAVIATLALLIIANVVLLGARDYTRGAQTFYGITSTVTLGGVLGLALLVIFLARLFRDSNAGLTLRASREDELAARSTGIDVERRRLLAWVLSACVMAVAGALLGNFLTAFSPNNFHYSLTFSLIAMLIIGGRATVSGAVVGAAIVTLLMELLRGVEDGPGVLPQFFGLAQLGVGIAILLVLYFRREGLLGRREVDEMLTAKLMREGDAERPARAVDVRARRASAPGSAGIVADSVSKHFAGVHALTDVSLTVAPGEIVGLIGPNGSGKTTLLNTISGVLAPDGGAVTVDGEVISGQPAHRVSQAGIARTFQNIRLFPELTALENVEAAIAAHRLPGSRDELARGALADFRIDHVDRPAGDSDYGRQRRLEIARALATGPRYLLLDEPAAGMNPAESADLMHMLRRVRDEYGVGLLVIDHDLDLIMKLCGRVVVLSSGREIASGPPAEVQAGPRVIEAYLGRKRPRQGKVKQA